MAHPDDAEFGAAGTVARWAKEGRQVTYLILTDGNRGSSDPAMTAERLAQIAGARFVPIANMYDTLCDLVFIAEAQAQDGLLATPGGPGR